MKLLSNILGGLAVVCFIALMLWGEQISEFNTTLYFMMFAVIVVGIFANLIQSERNHERTIATKAIAQYKKDNGIID